MNRSTRLLPCRPCCQGKTSERKDDCGLFSLLFFYSSSFFFCSRLKVYSGFKVLNQFSGFLLICVPYYCWTFVNLYVTFAGVYTCPLLLNFYLDFILTTFQFFSSPSSPKFVSTSRCLGLRLMLRIDLHSSVNNLSQLHLCFFYLPFDHRIGIIFTTGSRKSMHVSQYFP